MINDTVNKMMNDNQLPKGKINRQNQNKEIYKHLYICIERYDNISTCCCESFVGK